MNCEVIEMKSFSLEFCFQYHRSSPVMKPLKQLVGCAECGGMYKYKYKGFGYVLVCIRLCVMDISKSRNVVVVVGFSTFHLRDPN